MSSPFLSKHLKTAAKVAFVFGLLYFLTQKGFISVQNTKRAFESWQTLAVAFLVLSTMMVLGAVRWQWLLQAQGIEIRWIRVLELTLVGNFFNIALPGAVSGDFVKAFYVGKEIPGKRARAFGSILFDRVAGLSALVLVSGGAMLMEYSSHTDSQSAQMLHVLRPLMIFCGACVIGFYAYLFLMREHWDPVLKLLRKLESISQKFGSFVRIYEALRHYHHHRWVVMKALAISALVHLSVGWAFLQFATALGAGHLPLLSVYTVFPLGLLVTAIPVAPAGVGTGHAAFLYFFNLIGSPRGADIFTLYAFAQIAFGALGGLVYLRFRAHAEPVIDPQTTISNP